MPSRRKVILGSLGAVGALVVGWSVLPPRQRLLTADPLPAMPGQLPLNGWVTVGSDDTVTVQLARSEMGQGVHTSLVMLLADEMDADWSRVRTVAAPIDGIFRNVAIGVDGLPFHPDTQGALRDVVGWLTAKTMREIGVMATGGSSSVKDSWLPMREAGASARAMLVAAAAKTWSVAEADITVAAGVLRHAASGRQARFGEMAQAASTQKLPPRQTLKTPERWTLIGKPMPRRDSAAKADGSAVFGLDVRPPGLLHASLVLCPTLGGSAGGLGDEAARSMPGVVAVVRLPPLRGASGGVAVVANGTWRAMQAVRALKVSWDAGPAAALDDAAVTRRLKAALTTDGGFTYHQRGDVDAAFKTATRTISAEYQVPMLAHATMEPMNATVLLEGSRATVWAPTQVPDLARSAVAQVLGLDSSAVTVHVTLLGGGFGRRLEVDFIAMAAEVAKAVPGKPVQLTWSREQDMTHDFYRPPCVARYDAALNAAGAILAWRAQSASPSVVQQFLNRQWGLAGVGPDKTTAEGAFDNPYEWPHARIGHAIVELPLPMGFWRSVGHSHQAFFKECFLDEVAHAAGADPLAYREALLKQHPRHLAVLQAAARRAGWGQPLPAAPDGAKRARGLALHHSFGSIVAQVAEVSLDPKDKSIRVHRVVAAVDCGTVVNPDGVRQQMESAVVYGLSAALWGGVTLKQGQVQQSNFHDQPVLRLAQCPVIETEIMASTHPPEGMGEPGTPPIAPAVANALFSLTGQRLRALPLRLA
ncbi:MAG: molybdopterin cofactor-binding domain-containing protein [Aquabacterium sp.]